MSRPFLARTPHTCPCTRRADCRGTALRLLPVLLVRSSPSIEYGNTNDIQGPVVVQSIPWIFLEAHKSGCFANRNSRLGSQAGEHLLEHLP
jgi:hypothetical protein